ncbi:MAG: hypothetical protein ABI333_22330 [bacterium]
MRNLVLTGMVLLVAGMGLGVQSGCSAKTSCNKMKKKMDQCSDQLWRALEPRLRGRAPESWRQNKNTMHYRYCQKVKGRYKQAKAINDCLAQKSCAKFANCFCRAVKKDPKRCGKVK